MEKRFNCMKCCVQDEPPIVSIICLTFNHERYIREALDSFLKQKVDFKYEVVVHDDASSDKTQEIICEYQNKYPEIIRPILQKENQRSRGGNVFGNAYSAARGKYVAYCEGDDYWVDELKLSIQVNFLEKNLHYAITYADCEPLFEGNIIARKITAAARDLSSMELKLAPPIHSLSACFRRVIDIPAELGFVEYGDLFLWALIGHFGEGKYLNNFEPCRYRVHGGGVHSNQTRHRRYEMVVLTFALMARYFQRVGAGDLSAKYRAKIITETIKYLLKGVPGFSAAFGAIKAKIKLIAV